MYTASFKCARIDTYFIISRCLNNLSFPFVTAIAIFTLEAAGIRTNVSNESTFESDQNPLPTFEISA